MELLMIEIAGLCWLCQR